MAIKLMINLNDLVGPILIEAGFVLDYDYDSTQFGFSHVSYINRNNLYLNIIVFDDFINCIYWDSNLFPMQQKLFANSNNFVDDLKKLLREIK